MGNCADVCQINKNVEKIISINQSNEKINWTTYKSYNNSSVNTENTIISNNLINVNKKPSFGRNSKFKNKESNTKKNDSNDKNDDSNGISSDESFFDIENENKINENKKKKKYNFRGPIFSHLLKHSKSRKITF